MPAHQHLSPRPWLRPPCVCSCPLWRDPYVSPHPSSAQKPPWLSPLSIRAQVLTMAHKALHHLPCNLFDLSSSFPPLLLPALLHSRHAGLLAIPEMSQYVPASQPLHLPVPWAWNVPLRDHLFFNSFSCWFKCHLFNEDFLIKSLKSAFQPQCTHPSTSSSHSCFFLLWGTYQHPIHYIFIISSEDRAIP